MNKKKIIILFFTVHAILIFLHVHKHTVIIKNSYEQQHAEKELSALKEKKLMLEQELYALKDHARIKKFAQTQLSMAPYKLSHIITLPSLS